jgi:hypothetical protein
MDDRQPLQLHHKIAKNKKGKKKRKKTLDPAETREEAEQE